MDTSRLHWLDGFDLAALPSNHALERTRETEERDQSKEGFCVIASDQSATAGRSTPSLGTVATGAEEATMPSTGLKRLQDDWPLERCLTIGSTPLNLGVRRQKGDSLQRSH